MGYNRPKETMRRLLMCSLMLIMTSVVLNATIQLAVMDFKPGSSKSDNLEGLSDMLINSLYESGDYEIVERSQINYALKELNIQGQNLSVSQLTQLGKYLKVSHVLVGTVNFIATGNSSDPGFLEGEYNIDVRIVDVKSSRIIATAGVTKNSSQTYRSLMPDLASQLSKKINASTMPCIQGYLYVYPENLGKSSYAGANDKIKYLNAQNAFGRNNWRLPTIDELKMIAENLNLLNYDIGSGAAFSSDKKYYAQYDTDYYIYYLKEKKSDMAELKNIGERLVILVSTK